MHNSTEHEVSTAPKINIPKNKDFSGFETQMMCVLAGYSTCSIELIQLEFSMPATFVEDLKMPLK